MNNVYKVEKKIASPHFQWPKKTSQVFIELQSNNIPFSYGRPKTNNPFLKHLLCLKTRRVPINSNDLHFSNPACSPNTSIRENNTTTTEIKNQCNPYIQRRQQSVNQEEKLRFICDNNAEDCKILHKRVILPGISCKKTNCPILSMATYDKRTESIHKLSEHCRRGSLEKDHHKDIMSFNFNNEVEVACRLNMPRFSCAQTNRENKKLIHTIAFSKFSTDNETNNIRSKQFAGKYALRHRINNKQAKSQMEEPIRNNEGVEKIVSHRGFADIVKK